MIGNVGSQRNNLQGNYIVIVVYMCGMAQGLLYAQQRAKKRTDDMIDRDNEDEHCKFWKSMNTFIIPIAEHNPCVGEHTLHHKTGAPMIEKPYWLRQ